MGDTFFFWADMMLLWNLNSGEMLVCQTEEGKIAEISTCKDFLQVQNKGVRLVERNQHIYNIS